MKEWYKQTDIMLGMAVIAVVAMLVVPIPSFLLDLLMAVSIMIGLVTLLNSMMNKKNTSFSVFPSLLLITTVFRLALNVSSTRLILLKGPAFDAQLIRAFGEFVVQNQYIIGFIIFLILVLVQMMVITKGATRISEVAARFMLDSMPGKQMSIDADLSAGIITEEEAIERRQEIQREVDFYGQMDGATKFVQGDVRVGLIITAINIIGGLIVGMAIRGESLMDALRTYTLLTVGDGLVSQIPSLLITTATGLVVTRSASNEDLGEDLASQLFRNPRILWMVAAALGFSAIIPGFPKIPMVIIASFLAFLAFTITRNVEEEVKELREKEEKDEASRPVDSFLDEISVDPIRLEIGYNLLPLVEKKSGGTLLDQITNLRQKFARELGMIIPPVRIRDNLDLDGNEYAVLIGGIELARTKVYPEFLVALKTPDTREEIEGDAYEEPTFKVQGVLIPSDMKTDAENKGYAVVDAKNIIITQLTEIVRNNASQIMGREEVKKLLDKVKEKYPAVVEEIDQKTDVATIQSVLHSMLKENISIRNMPLILENIANNAQRIKDADLLYELVRRPLGRQIVSAYLDENSVLDIIQVDPEIENIMRGSVSYDESEGKIFAMDPRDQIAIRDGLVQAYNEVQAKEYLPIFLVSSEIRAGIVMILEREISMRNFVVLAYEEMPPNVQLNILTSVSINETANTE